MINGVFAFDGSMATRMMWKLWRGESAKSVLRPEFSVAVGEVFDAARTK
jgi:hypothetical protein